MRHSSLNPDARSHPIARAILGYLDSFPEAQDTARGISDWWLPHAGVRCSRAELQQTLDHLVNEGVLTFRPSADGCRHYRLNRIEPGRGTERDSNPDPDER